MTEAKAAVKYRDVFRAHERGGITAGNEAGDGIPGYLRRVDWILPNEW